jgi:hypothetical protein
MYKIAHICQGIYYLWRKPPDQQEVDETPRACQTRCARPSLFGNEFCFESADKFRVTYVGGKG